MKEKFAIKDITSDLLLLEDDRPVSYVTENGFDLSFNTYPEAMEKIKTLPKGYYQIDKFFIQE